MIHHPSLPLSRLELSEIGDLVDSVAGWEAANQREARKSWPPTRFVPQLLRVDLLLQQREEPLIVIEQEEEGAAVVPPAMVAGVARPMEEEEEVAEDMIAHVMTDLALGSKTMRARQAMAGAIMDHQVAVGITLSPPLPPPIRLIARDQEAVIVTSLPPELGIEEWEGEETEEMEAAVGLILMIVEVEEIVTVILLLQRAGDMREEDDPDHQRAGGTTETGVAINS
jgi:hypothetical protein